MSPIQCLIQQRHAALASMVSTSKQNMVTVFGLQVNAEGVFKYAYIPWFAQALQVLALSGVHGVAVDVWVSSTVVETAAQLGGSCGCQQQQHRKQVTLLACAAGCINCACARGVCRQQQLALQSCSRAGQWCMMQVHCITRGAVLPHVSQQHLFKTAR